MHQASIRLGLLALAMATSVGCGAAELEKTPKQKTPTTGELGKQEKLGFSYHSSKRSCTFGCGMMKGTHETIWIDPWQPTDIVVESSDPAILVVQPGFST